MRPLLGELSALLWTKKVGEKMKIIILEIIIILKCIEIKIENFLGPKLLCKIYNNYAKLLDCAPVRSTLKKVLSFL